MNRSDITSQHSKCERTRTLVHDYSFLLFLFLVHVSVQAGFRVLCVLLNVVRVSVTFISLHDYST